MMKFKKLQRIQEMSLQLIVYWITVVLEALSVDSNLIKQKTPHIYPKSM